MAGQIYNDFLGTSGTSAPVINTTSGSSSKDVSDDLEKTRQTNPSMWGNIVSGITGMIGSFNYRAQENQIQLAQAQADAARANADAAANQGNKKYLWIGVGIVVVIVLVVLLKRK